MYVNSISDWCSSVFGDNTNRQYFSRIVQDTIELGTRCIGVVSPALTNLSSYLKKGDFAILQGDTASLPKYFFSRRYPTKRLVELEGGEVKYKPSPKNGIAEEGISPFLFDALYKPVRAVSRVFLSSALVTFTASSIEEWILKNGSITQFVVDRLALIPLVGRKLSVLTAYVGLANIGMLFYGAHCLGMAVHSADYLKRALEVRNEEDLTKSIAKGILLTTRYTLETAFTVAALTGALSGVPLLVASVGVTAFSLGTSLYLSERSRLKKEDVKRLQL